MKPDTDRPIRRVRSSDGRVWETTASNAADYLFNPVFMTFFLLCVILYATLMQPSEETSMSVLAQVFLWGGLIMTSLIWLTVSVWLSVQAYDRGWLGVISTPLLLLPLVFINVYLGEFILSEFSPLYEGSYGSKIENVLQNSVILICFDIMHSRFVAPQHPTYVKSGTHTPASPDQPWSPTAPYVVQAPIGMAEPTIPPLAGNVVTAAPVPFEEQPAQIAPERAKQPDEAATGVPTQIEIARTPMDPQAILWVKSEDHYLIIQLKDESLMLRGKLRTAVGKLGDELGLQINRSVWVAFAAIVSVEENSAGYLEVHLEDETVQRVASSRQLVFKHNFERFKATQQPCDPVD